MTRTRHALRWYLAAALVSVMVPDPRGPRHAAHELRVLRHDVYDGAGDTELFNGDTWVEPATPSVNPACSHLDSWRTVHMRAKFVPAAARLRASGVTTSDMPLL